METPTPRPEYIKQLHESSVTYHSEMLRLASMIQPETRRDQKRRIKFIKFGEKAVDLAQIQSEKYAKDNAGSLYDMAHYEMENDLGHRNAA